MKSRPGTTDPRTQFVRTGHPVDQFGEQGPESAYLSLSQIWAELMRISAQIPGLEETERFSQVIDRVNERLDKVEKRLGALEERRKKTARSKKKDCSLNETPRHDWCPFFGGGIELTSHLVGSHVTKRAYLSFESTTYHRNFHCITLLLYPKT
jgi:hypothetical protein